MYSRVIFRETIEIYNYFLNAFVYEKYSIHTMQLILHYQPCGIFLKALDFVSLNVKLKLNKFTNNNIDHFIFMALSLCSKLKNMRIQFITIELAIIL